MKDDRKRKLVRDQLLEESSSLTNGDEEKKINPLWIWTCYLLALILVVFILYSSSGIIADILSSWFNHDIGRLDVANALSLLFLISFFTFVLGNHWRLSEKNEIGTAFTNFPNPFYDPEYKKRSLATKGEVRELNEKLVNSQRLLQGSLKYSEETEELIQQYEGKLRVLIRHNENANRVLKSFNFLLDRSDIDIHPKMLKHILSECTTILEKDLSDKSISLFQVEGDELSIIGSVRINAESIAKRSFKKGIGFAGHIWNTGEPEIINRIEKEDARFHDQGIPATPIGSILGFPLIVDNHILGVLCLQSEREDGFSDADLRTVEYYARMCTLMLLHDKIRSNRTEGGAGNDSNH